MNKVKLICDSTMDIEPEIYEQEDIDVVPLHVAFKGDPKDYKDGIDIDTLKIYEKVKECGETPKTGAVNVGEWMDVFQKYIDKGYDIVVTTLGTNLSSCYQNAVIASQEFDEGRIFVLESGNLSTGSGLLLMKQIKYKNEGLSAKEIYEKVQPLAEKVSAKFCIENLDYLYKGGRCSGLALLAANALHIHPVAKMINGKLVVYKKPRGPYRKSVEEQINEFKNDLPNIDLDCVYITDSYFLDGEDDYVYSVISKLMPKENIHRSKSGCTISSHCGPKTIGILYILK